MKFDSSEIIFQESLIASMEDKIARKQKDLAAEYRRLATMRKHRKETGITK